MACAQQLLIGIVVLWGSCLAVSSSPAGEFYFSGVVGTSGGAAHVSGSNTLAGFELSGQDVDSSPALGGVLGFEFMLSDVISREIRVPESLPWKPKIPDFNVRFEVEGIGGRDYEFKTKGFNSMTPYHTEVNSWSLMFNGWLALPISPPTRALFGRIQALEPIAIYFGAGVGFNQIEVQTTDGLVWGSSAIKKFAYQLGAGVSYDITHRFQVSIGYRRVEMGNAWVDLIDGAGVSRGAFDVGLHSNEAILALKTQFYSIPWPHRSRRESW